MHVSVNGEPQQIPAGITVTAFLETLGLGGTRVAVAVNREVVPRAVHSARVLAEGDRVEIVHAVQGG